MEGTEKRRICSVGRGAVRKCRCCLWEDSPLDRGGKKENGGERGREDRDRSVNQSWFCVAHQYLEQRSLSLKQWQIITNADELSLGSA